MESLNVEEYINENGDVIVNRLITAVGIKTDVYLMNDWDFESPYVYHRHVERINKALREKGLITCYHEVQVYFLRFTISVCRYSG
jgi:hypothetical protein